MSIEEIIHELALEGSAYEEMIAGTTVTDSVKERWARRVTAMREAITLLKTHQEAQPNEPLTLEELRGMDGEVAWCNEYKCWGLISVERNVKREGIPFFNMSRKGCLFTYSIKRRKLTIYRRPPKED